MRCPARCRRSPGWCASHRPKARRSRSRCGRCRCANYGSFVALIPPPLGIGTLLLADGSTVQGFVCEPHALAGAADITHFGGWRDYIASQKPVAA